MIFAEIQSKIRKFRLWSE